MIVVYLFVLSETYIIKLLQPNLTFLPLKLFMKKYIWLWNFLTRLYYYDNNVAIRLFKKYEND